MLAAAAGDAAAAAALGEGAGPAPGEALAAACELELAVLTAPVAPLVGPATGPLALGGLLADCPALPPVVLEDSERKSTPSARAVDSSASSSGDTSELTGTARWSWPMVTAFALKLDCACSAVRSEASALSRVF